jgi:transcriptional regulator with XRE-family HTH domain
VEIGKRIKELREERGLSQREVARRAGLTPSAVGFIEHGQTRNPSVETVVAVARALGVGAGELFRPKASTGKAKAPPAGLDGWIQKALEEDHFAASFGLAKYSQEEADKLHRAKIKESDEKRLVVKTLKDHHAAPGAILEEQRDLAMLNAQAAAAGFLSIEMSRGRDVSDLDPRVIIADVIQTHSELFADQHSSVLENPPLAQDADTAR